MQGTSYDMIVGVGFERSFTIITYSLQFCKGPLLRCTPSPIAVPSLYKSNPRVRFSTPMMLDSDDHADCVVLGALL